MFPVRSVAICYKEVDWIERVCWDSSVEKSQSKAAVAEEREQFRNLKEEQSLPLEAVYRRLVKTVTEATSVYVCV
jgi:hypothetical protein